MALRFRLDSSESEPVCGGWISMAGRRPLGGRNGEGQGFVAIAVELEKKNTFRQNVWSVHSRCLGISHLTSPKFFET